MLEKEVEQTFVKHVKKAGGTTIKLTDPAQAGLPDRLTILPGGHTGFIEFKAPGQKPRPLQQHRITQLQDLGCTVLVIDHPTQIPKALHEIRTA